MKKNYFVQLNQLKEIEKIINEKKIFFIHIPKTGGTTLNNIFINNDWFVPGGHCSFIKYTKYPKSINKFYNFFKNSKLKNLTSSFEEAGYKKGMLKLAVIRNPKDWLFSIYSHLSYSSFLGIEFNKHRGWGNILGCNNINSFEEFVIKFCNNKFNDYLISEQLKPILHNGKLEVDIIIKNEYLNDFIKQYSKIKGVMKEIKSSNKSLKKRMYLSPFASEQIEEKFNLLDDLFYKSPSRFFLKESLIKLK